MTPRTARTGRKIGTVTLPGLPPVTLAGLFTASPDYEHESQSFGGGVNGSSGPTQATAVIDHVSGLAGAWTGGYIGGDYSSGIGGYHRSGGQFTVTGSGDIAPIAAGHGRAGGFRRHRHRLPAGHVRRADRAGRSGRDVHDRRVPAEPDPDHAGRQPATRPGAGREGDRGRRGVLRRRAGGRDRRGARRAARSPTPAATTSSPCRRSTEVRVIIGTGLLVAVTAVLILAVGP